MFGTLTAGRNRWSTDLHEHGLFSAARQPDFPLIAAVFKFNILSHYCIDFGLLYYFAP